jgi:hypothetical protein
MQGVKWKLPGVVLEDKHPLNVLPGGWTAFKISLSARPRLDMLKLSMR